MAAAAQPPNDSCASALSIAGYASFAWTNVDATTDGTVELCPSSRQINGDVWFCWESSEDIVLAVRSCGGTTHDTIIAVYEGCACNPGTLLGCNDDQCGLQSSVTFLATAGGTYAIRIGSVSATLRGSGTFSVGAAQLAGPIASPDNSSNYYLIEANRWDDAEATANLFGGHLVTIDSAEENEFVRFSVMEFDGQDRRAWIGFNDAAAEGQFEWVSGAPVTYTNWGGGEPNNSGGAENYAEILGSSGTWNDVQINYNLTRWGLVEVTAAIPIVPGDMNCDQALNNFDIDPFVLALVDPAGYAAAFPGCSPAHGDVNQDGMFNNFDIDPFVACIVSGCP